MDAIARGFSMCTSGTWGGTMALPTWGHRLCLLAGTRRSCNGQHHVHNPAAWAGCRWARWDLAARLAPKKASADSLLHCILFAAAPQDEGQSWVGPHHWLNHKFNSRECARPSFENPADPSSISTLNSPQLFSDDDICLTISSRWTPHAPERDLSGVSLEAASLAAGFPTRGAIGELRLAGSQLREANLLGHPSPPQPPPPGCHGRTAVRHLPGAHHQRSGRPVLFEKWGGTTTRYWGCPGAPATRMS